MALTQDRDLSFYAPGELIDFPTDANVLIFKGGFVGRNRATGYARPLAIGDDFLGLAYQQADNTFDGNGPGTALVRLHRHIDIVHTLSGVLLADVGKEVFASADDTLTLAPTGNSRIGRIVAVEATNLARVRIQPQSTAPGISESMGVTTLADSNATLTLDHVGRTLLMSNAAARTLTLPAVAQVRAGGWIRVVKTSSAAAAITLDGNGAETIDGAATFAGVDAIYDTVLLVCTGTEWVILSRDIA
jgi:hypothetical protein